MSHNKKLEEQMVLRLPPQLADQVRKMLRTKQLTEEIEFEFDADQRNAKFKVGKKKYDAYLVDLPCNVETHKTLDKTTYYKSADIGQMLVVQDPKDPQPPPEDYNSLNGITPATRDIRRRKWRKPPDAAMLKEIEIEVNRLLKPAENESIEILNADDFEDLDEMNGVVEKIEISKPAETPKIKFKMPTEVATSPEPPAEPQDKKKKKGERKKKEKKEKKEPETPASTGGEGEAKPKKEKRRRKKEKPEGEAAAPAAGGQPSSTEKKKEHKKRERKPKAKTAAAAAAATAANTTDPSHATSPPSTPTTAPTAFPFSNTITPLPPPLAMPTIPPVFQQAPNTNKIATPAFNSNPFANASASSFTSIATTPISHAQPLVPIVPPTHAQDNAGNQNLLAQQKKLQQEVEQMKLKVADATQKYNILPNALLKSRHQAKLQEVTEQHAQKVKELEAVEQQLKAVGH